MIRLAHENGKKVQRFYRHWFGTGSLPLWTRDLDRLAPAELLRELGRRTGLPADPLESATLRSLVGSVFTELPTGGPISWLMTLGVFHRQRRLAGLMCCTQCLREDETPYFRKSWRLSWVTACTRHKCMLVDRCACGATLQPHRVDMRHRRLLTEGASLAACWSCGSDLRSIAAQGADPEVLTLLAYAERAVEFGHVDVAGRNGLHSILFFQGLRVLLLATLRLDRSARANSEGSTRFDELPVHRRADNLRQVSRLLTDWPDAFHRTFSSEKNVYSHFTRHSPSRPFWVDEEVSLLKKARIEMTVAEGEAIASVVEAQTGKFHHTTAYELFGRDLSRLRARQRPKITQDDADMLLAGIDIAASTATGVVREDLIRDRVMFLTARLLRLSHSELGEIRVDSYWSEVDDEPLEDTPTNEAELLVYLRRYVRLDRVKHTLATSSPWLFLCNSKTGQMSRSLVGARYTHALQLANMRWRIPKYQDWIAAPAGAVSASNDAPIQP